MSDRGTEFFQNVFSGIHITIMLTTTVRTYPIPNSKICDTFRPRIGQCAAIHDDQRFGGAVAVLVDQSRHDFLSGAAFAEYEHGDVGPGDFHGLLEEQAHGGLREVETVSLSVCKKGAVAEADPTHMKNPA
jgi:hypothetical protein